MGCSGAPSSALFAFWVIKNSKNHPARHRSEPHLPTEWEADCEREAAAAVGNPEPGGDPDRPKGRLYVSHKFLILLSAARLRERSRKIIWMIRFNGVSRPSEIGTDVGAPPPVSTGGPGGAVKDFGGVFAPRRRVNKL